jgi:hypothetical protein
VIKGRNTRVENIEFSQARVADRNGAGIRLEGAGLTVVDCFFHDNEAGILTNDNPNSVVVIERSEFARHGHYYETGQMHGIYIGAIDSLTIRASYFHHTHKGHLIKTRARNNFILYNRIADEAEGSASHAIDISNGGTSYVIGNVIHKGPHAMSPTTIGYALEGAVNPGRDLYVVNNTFLSDAYAGRFIEAAPMTSAHVVNNIFVGSGIVLRGAGRLANNLLAGRPGLVGQVGTVVPDYGSGRREAGNRTTRDAKLVDPTNYDVRPLARSPAIDAGVDPGRANGVNLWPEAEYVHPAGERRRPRAGRIDMGAYEFPNNLER